MIGALRGKLGIAYRRYLERRAYDALMAHPALAAIIGAARRPGFQFYEEEVTTNVDYSDSLTLYRWVKANRPREILECGPGVSTLVMAQALHENGGGHITTLENMEKFYTKAKESCPAHLAPYIDYRLTTAVKKRYGPFMGVGYEEIPDRPYDFIFVDGPNYDAATEFDVDLLEIIGKSERPISAIIDSRTGSSFMYHLALGDKFSYRYLTGLGFVDQATKADLKPYKKIVADTMRQRQFKRARI